MGAAAGGDQCPAELRKTCRTTSATVLVDRSESNDTNTGDVLTGSGARGSQTILEPRARLPECLFVFALKRTKMFAQLLECKLQQSNQASCERRSALQIPSRRMALRKLASRWRAGAGIAAAMAAGGGVAYCEDPKGVGFDPEALERGAAALREINKSPYAKKVCISDGNCRSQAQELRRVC